MAQGLNGKRSWNKTSSLYYLYLYIVFNSVMNILFGFCRANDERVGDMNRALNFDQKARDLTSQNGTSTQYYHN